MAAVPTKHRARTIVLPLLAVAATILLQAPGPAAAETSAERGYRLLLTLPLVPPTLTEAEYFELWQVWPEPQRAAAAAAPPAERRRMLLERYGFQETPDRPGPIPQQFTSDGKGNLSENCLSCHGGPVAGEVIRGLGNSLIDLATFYEDVAALRAARGIPAPPWPEGVPLAPESPVRGPNNAWGGAIALLLLRDRNADRTDTLQFPAPTPEQMFLPTKTPAFWLSKRKTRYYADAFIGKSHRDIMQFIASFAYSGEQIRALEEPFRDIYAWINAVEAPPYPGPVDPALVQRGRLVYLRDCVACHGIADSYPERVIPVAEVGTDPVRALDMPRDFKLHLGEGWFGMDGATPLYPDTGGYVAQPLDGVWATAPYLHNGSVPTMWDLLTPSERPKIWSRSDAGYDHARLGVEATAHAEMPADLTDPAERRRYYRTDQRGFGNQGHAYPPAGLPDADKRALIEFLKTL